MYGPLYAVWVLSGSRCIPGAETLVMMERLLLNGAISSPDCSVRGFNLACIDAGQKNSGGLVLRESLLPVRDLCLLFVESREV